MSDVSRLGMIICVALCAACAGEIERELGEPDEEGLDAAADSAGAAPDLDVVDLDAADLDDLTAPEQDLDAPEMDAPDLSEVADMASTPDMSAPPDMSMPPDMAAPAPCVTRITYGSSWIHGTRATMYDDVNGVVSWDGACKTDSSGNSYATLSNGWRPYFEGKGSCIIALDQRGACPNTPTSCETRISYGPRWQAAPNHPASYDDVGGVVTWEGSCRASGSSSFARLSNGWEPHFQGSNACDISLRHTQCGGLYTNPVIDANCPDPGVTQDGTRYVLTCTHTGGSGIFPIYTSTDMTRWSLKGKILASKPGWANDRFWAPEIHKVAPNRYVAYYSASERSNNKLAIGAATASSATGPFTDIGRPLVSDPTPGVIDAHYFQASDGRRFLLWKRDGNAIGQKTPIFMQELGADGITRRGAVHTVLTNDQSWEGALVEGQWLVERGGYFYLFYSGNGYASASYGIGVARATSPTGPYTKASGGPLLRTNHAWDGPGHGSVLKGPSGDWVHVYHAWVKGKVNQSPGRLVLVDRITWPGGWPKMLGAPSRRSQPLP
jgi:arabinan endo-1,5-alpha-L-arabinosidase